MNLGLLWDISDTFNGLMAVPNLIALLMLSGLGLILHNFQDFSFYGPVYTLIKHGHLGCALLWALLVLVRLARRGLWWDRRRGTGRRAPA